MRSFTLTYLQCAQWGVQTLSECLDGAWTFTKKCVEWAWQTAEECSWWSFFVCVLWAVVTTLVCVLVETVAVFTCLILVIISWVVCFFWTLISIIFCLSYRYGGTAFLLTDGTVMVQEWQVAVTHVSEPTHRWWKLSPDRFGSYANGTWSRLADSRIARAAFASALLADGRVVVCGGEDSDASGSVTQDFTNTCDIYDPVANTWTPFDPPTVPGSSQAWEHIGDAPCTLLPDGKLLMGSIFDANVAKLDPATLTWTAMNPRPAVSSSDEESWVLMADNTIVAPSCPNAPTTWVYDIAADFWKKGQPPLAQSVIGPGEEIGPGLLLYDGRAFFLGGNQHTAFYAAPDWSNGPDMPNQERQPIGVLDGPGALLVNGNVLFGAGFHVVDQGGNVSEPSFYFEFDGNTFYKTNDPPNSNCFTMDTRLLLLPNGDIMFCRDDDSSFYAYTSPATPEDSFRPVIQSCPAVLVQGLTIQISGVQFNGLSQAVAYGDDSQTATNYPLVRVVNSKTGHVRYCHTFNHTTINTNGNPIPAMGVATGTAVITTNADIPADLELGPSQLFVVANGIPSLPFEVNVTSSFRSGAGAQTKNHDTGRLAEERGAKRPKYDAQKDGAK